MAHTTANEKGPAAENDRAPRETTTESPDCARGDARRKVVEDMRARLALAGGHVLHELPDGSFLVCKWGMSRALPDLRAVAAFLRQIGGR
jgi:hypothetical protein